MFMTGKSRGYAFVEYEHKADMKEAYKAADGKKIEGRRVLVDVERGRTVENWCVGNRAMVQAERAAGRLLCRMAECCWAACLRAEYEQH